MKGYEVRLAIMDVHDVPNTNANADDVLFQDIFVKAHLSGYDEQKKETDTHWRCQTGEGNFNWRLLFNFNGPKEDIEDEKRAYKLEIQCKERNIFSSNKDLATFELDLYQIVQYCKYTNEALKLNQETWDGTMRNDYQGFSKSYSSQLPKDEADKAPTPDL